MRNASKTSIRLRAGLLAVGALSLGLAACDGSNAFAPVGVGPSVVELFAPEQTQGGAEFQVAARAVAAVRVDSIVVTVQGGGIDYRQTQTNSGRESDVTYTFDVPVPVAVSDTIATISAIAFDAQGNQSLVRTRTIRLVDAAPPVATLTVSADSVSQGDLVGFSVTAVDNIGVARTGIEVRDPAGQVVFTDSVSGTPTQQPSFQWQIPDAPVFGEYTARAFAVDVSGNRGTSESVTFRLVFEDRDAPEVEILQPVSSALVVAAGDSVFVRARVQDNVEIQSIRFRGVAILEDGGPGTADVIDRFTPRQIVYDESVNVDDVTVTRYLRFDLSSLQASPPSGAEESLLLIVEAVDTSGRVGADTFTVTLAHDVVPPRVSILSPADGSSYFQADTLPIPISFTVADDQGPIRTGVTRVTVEVKQLVATAGGGIDDTPLAPARSFSLQDAGQLQPIVNPVTFDYVIPGLVRDTDAADRYFFVIITAQDAAGLLGADTLRLVSLGPPPVAEPASPAIIGSEVLPPAGAPMPFERPRRPEEEN
jgi:hypothetical protein